MKREQLGVDEMVALGFFGRVRLAFAAMSALAESIVDPWGQMAFQWALDAWGTERVVKRAQHDQAGRRLLETRPNFDIDLAAYEQMPEGSLGRFLASWYRAWGIKPFGPRRVPKGDTEYFVDRLFFTHDVWHALVGLGIDHANEMRFLAVLLAQYASGSAIVGLFIGWLEMPWKTGLRSFLALPREVWEFYQWSRRSKNLCFVDWGEFLPLPLEEVRARLLADGRPHHGQWETWPSSRIILPAEFVSSPSQTRSMP